MMFIMQKLGKNGLEFIDFFTNAFNNWYIFQISIARRDKNHSFKVKDKIL